MTFAHAPADAVPPPASPFVVLRPQTLASFVAAFNQIR